MSSPFVVGLVPPTSDLATRILLLILLCLLKLAAQLAYLVIRSHAVLVLGHARTHHHAGGRTQLCSLKGKVNSCARDSWSSHDIPSPNISRCGRQGASAREGSIYNLDGAQKLQLPRPCCSSFHFFTSHFAAIMREVMIFSLVFSPYNSPAFASKQAQRSKLENVMAVRNRLNANVYLSDVDAPRFLHCDCLLNPLSSFFHLTGDQPSTNRSREKRAGGGVNIT